jgi:two-component system, sporulation sensor kinase E
LLGGQHRIMENEAKILIVDDRPENLVALEAILESSSYKLVTVNSGVEALKQVLIDNYTVILLDVQMPGLNGYETAKLIRSREKSRRIPIIFITANHQAREQVLEGYALGAIDYIFKPIDPKILRDKITGYVNLFRHQEQLEILVEQRTQELKRSNEELRKEIKQRKLADQQLQKEIMIRKTSDAHFKAVFKESRLGIVIITREGTIIKANPEFQRMLGYTEQELIGMASYEYTYSDDRENFNKLINGEIDQYEMEMRYIRKDGELIWGYLNTFYTKVQDQEIIIAFIQDITEKKNMEKEMARLDRLNIVGEMAAGISHEVRNPMTIVKGFLQLLKSKDDCRKHQDYFDLMIDELDRANSIVTEFLSIGRNKPSHLEKQNLNSIINALLPLIQADALGQDKVVKVETLELPDLMLDGKEIRQVILNMCRNGLEAMSPGGLLTIKTYSTNEHVVLVIQDQGKGIEPEVLEKLGTPFLTTKANGTGLGLSICYSIAARHNATINVNTCSKGTTFYINFKIT